MRINVYSEEMTDRVELVKNGDFTGVRFYLELPVALATPPTKLGAQPGITHISGPFVHKANDDDSAAVTFWGKRKLRGALIRALQLLDQDEAPATKGMIDEVSDKMNAAMGYSKGTHLEVVNEISRLRNKISSLVFGPTISAEIIHQLQLICKIVGEKS